MKPISHYLELVTGAFRKSPPAISPSAAPERYGILKLVNRIPQIIGVRFGVMIAGGLLGFASATFALSRAGLSDVQGQAGWQQWNLSAETSMQPYSLGRFLADGQLPPSNAQNEYFRSTDKDGKALRGDCRVTLKGKLPPARWWTIAAVTRSGQTASPASVISAAQAILEADGSIELTVNASPVPGNWITPPPGGYSLVVTLNEMTETTALALPIITQEGC
jgi:hypothetical protein